MVAQPSHLNIAKKAIGLFNTMETTLMIMLALATLSTTTTAPRTRATTTSLGPRSSTLWGPTTTWGQEGAVDSYKNEHGIHAAPQQHGSESGRQAAEAGLGQAESVRSSACGCEGAGTVPSGVAIGPTGGRGASPLGGALTLKHKMEPHRSQERAAVRSPGVKRGSMALCTDAPGTLDGPARWCN